MSETSPAPAAGPAPVLSLRGVSKRFGAVAALTDIDLDVNAGEVVALVGDNGAGKSTLVKILAGVHAPSSGTITFNGARSPSPTRAPPSTWASPPSSRTSRFAKTSTSSPTSTWAAS